MVEKSSLLASVSVFTWLIIWVIFDLNYQYEASEHAVYYALLYLLTLTSLFIWYRYRAPALYPLALVLTSISAAIVSLLSKALLESNDSIASFFLIAMVVVGVTSGSLYWLKKWQKQFSEMASLEHKDARNSDVKTEVAADE
tara:strand:- start:487 stop:912 length:426 start_codon:yes stop_codon:yes gene_type:complete